MWKDLKLPDGRDRVVRHGHGLARSYGVSKSTISRLAAPGPFEVSAVGV
jgi:hypothetical protein